MLATTKCSFKQTAEAQIQVGLLKRSDNGGFNVISC
jgi:hypothetical protein